MSTRDYYVVFSDEHGWHVKLERGRNAKAGYTRRHIDKEGV